MRICALARGRAAVSCAAVALIAALAGCGTTTSSTATVTGNRLTVYTSVPSTDQDVYDAEKLALSQAGGKVGKYTIALKMRIGDTTKEISQNARVAVSNSSTIAYLGESVPGTSGTSLEITNQVGILQISPTDNALELTQSTPAVSGGVNHYYPSQSSNGYTFGRVVPSGTKEAKAQVQEMQALGVSKLYVADDGQPYGKAIALAVRSDVKAPMTVTSTPAAADAVFYGTNSVAAAVKELNSFAQQSPGAKLFGPYALDTPSFATAVSAAPVQPKTYISAPGTLPSAATAAATTFAGDFKSAYGHSPAPQAIYGFEAMSALLAVLRNEGTNAANRSDVVNGFHALKNRISVLGSYSIDAAGDPSLAQFVFSHLKLGKLVPFKSLTVQG
jgi:branched-chain amino acid transport system substrate-binding protein